MPQTLVDSHHTHTEILISAAVQRVRDHSARSTVLKKKKNTKMFLGILRFYLCKKNICQINIIMSKLHFANLSFDEKSSDTLRENEKYLRFCLINIYFFLHKQNLKIPRNILVYFLFFLSDCGPSNEVANTLYCSGYKNLCVCLAQLRSRAAGRGGGCNALVEIL